MTAQTPNPQAQTEVRAMLESWLSAVRTADVERITAHYADDIVAFDAVAALRFAGRTAYQKHWGVCMENVPPGELIYEPHDLRIEAGADLAFAYALFRCGVRSDSGEEQSAWTRMTVCYRKTGGRWLVAHEHFSAPFDMDGNGRALLDLQP